MSDPANMIGKFGLTFVTTFNKIEQNVCKLENNFYLVTIVDDLIEWNVCGFPRERKSKNEFVIECIQSVSYLFCISAVVFRNIEYNKIDQKV